ncbi:hypothetical protein M440DRAFT_1136070 [Trichoderma longibrachiatum ATCC 18648]|uniref:Secreted protein n=1 Tax=Trichoderma longibrachiatum ATCC 18648 TaxID=983965 RepID=A0A2T4CGX7_TRILO|nr:hypothetical protein M440DRAFT_1136070 [Trichoderma longibrachiatum ATCC 18648]
MMLRTLAICVVESLLDASVHTERACNGRDLTSNCRYLYLCLLISPRSLSLWETHHATRESHHFGIRQNRRIRRFIFISVCATE